MVHTRELFLIGVGVVYLIAFASFYIQIPGLYGDDGILPAKNVVRNPPKNFQDFLSQPSLIRYKSRYWLDTESALDAVSILGMALSFLSIVTSEMRTTLVFVLLWVLYMSLYSVGQKFLWFQWDSLLLEAGFLAIIAAPLRILRLPAKHQHDRITMWLVKWLLFRLMYASGTVKLQSRCPTWWNLTALDWHFESQCIPTPPAWYFHHLPKWFLKLSNAIVFITQIPVSFLFFSPISNLRIFSFYAQVVLQVLILLTGNYNFFNLLTIVLCFSLLNDEDQRTVKKRGVMSGLGSYLSTFVSLFVYAVLAVFSVKYFGVSVEGYKILTKINFAAEDFNNFTYFAVGSSIWVGVISLFWEIAEATMRSFTHEAGFIKKIYSFISTAVISVVVVYMFCISLVPHTVVDRSIQSQLPSPVMKWYRDTERFHLTSSYGLFRRMTGVGGRPEIVVLGSNDKKTWQEYEFLYKPGDVNRMPPIVAPHQPRLDWQMWFAALGSYQYNDWFMMFCYRLVTNEPCVINLIQHNPFPRSPPKYVKALLYTYHYSSFNTKQEWWLRGAKPKEYLAPSTKEFLAQYLKGKNIIIPHRRYAPYGKLDASFRRIRQAVNNFDHFIFVSSLPIIALLTLSFNSQLLKKSSEI